MLFILHLLLLFKTNQSQCEIKRKGILNYTEEKIAMQNLTLTDTGFILSVPKYT